MPNKIFPSQLTSGLWYIITATETLRQDRNRKKILQEKKDIYTGIELWVLGQFMKTKGMIHRLISLTSNYNQRYKARKILGGLFWSTWPKITWLMFKRYNYLEGLLKSNKSRHCQGCQRSTKMRKTWICPTLF